MMSCTHICNTILAFFRLRKKREELSSVSLDCLFGNDMFRGLDDDKADPWYSCVYWAIYRFFKYSRWTTPRRIYSETRSVLQRARRGWADSDTWNLDSYLNRWMPDALRYLKRNKQGIPSCMFEPEDLISEGDSSEEGMTRAQARWDAILDKMIAAFEASRRINEGLYLDELGDFPMRRPAGVSVDAWKRASAKNMEAIQIFTKRDQKIFEEGMALFVKHYHSLWD